MFTSLCGYMVTTVTVTVSMSIRERQKHYGLQGETLRLAGEDTMARRERNGIFRPCAYTQTIVCLYANNCSPIPDLNSYTVNHLSIL